MKRRKETWKEETRMACEEGLVQGQKAGRKKKPRIVLGNETRKLGRKDVS